MDGRGGPSSTSLPALDVVLTPGRSEAWEARHRAGEVPGRWPYGLDRLGDGPARREVRLRAMPEPRRGARLRALVPRRPGRRPTALAWDENLALRVVASGDYDEMHCGVIWASDQWAADRRGVPRAVRSALAAMTSVWTLSRPQVHSLDGLVPRGIRRSFVKFGVDHHFYSAHPYPERPMVFSVGGDRDRDTETLLRAFELVRAARPTTRMLLQTRRHVRVPPGVEVVPHLSHVELREAYRAASVVAVATRPNLHVSGMTVSLEAQSTARPVVLTGTPGTEDYVADESTGHLTPVGDAAATADRIIGLLDDPDAASQMGLRGRAAIEEEYSEEHLARRLLRAIEP